MCITALVSTYLQVLLFAIRKSLYSSLDNNLKIFIKIKDKIKSTLGRSYNMLAMSTVHIRAMIFRMCVLICQDYHFVVVSYHGLK